MITKDIIKKLYKIHKRPVGEEGIMPQVNEFVTSLADTHNFGIQDGNLILEDVDNNSIFKTIHIGRICGFENFDRNIAMILPNSILFFNKADNGINIHIKLPEESMIDKIKAKASALFGA